MKEFLEYLSSEHRQTKFEHYAIHIIMLILVISELGGIK